MKKYVKVIVQITLIVLVLLSIVVEVKAVGIDQLGNPDSYIQNNGDDSKAIQIGNVIVSVIKGVGEAIAVLMLSIIGIKYVMGSVEEKAEYKQTIWPYILGAVLIFAGSAVTSIIYEIVTGT